MDLNANPVTTIVPSVPGEPDELLLIGTEGVPRSGDSNPQG